MVQEWQPDAIVRIKLDQIKKDFFDYIKKNIDKIDSNVPVFFGHITATLEKTLPDINDDLYDKFIDTITARVLDASKRSTEVSFVEKLFEHAIRNKRKRKGRTIYDILLGLKMINTGKYSEAIEQLKPHRVVDAIICPSISYCYFVLSTQQGDESDAAGRTVRGPNQMALAAREQMIELIRLNPPVNRLKDLEVVDDPRINKVFWFMIKQSIEWFPSERELIRIGLDKASRDGMSDIKEELLGIAIERFPNDMYFLRELYKLKLEKRDAGGVAGVVKQMTQQYPEELEPLYYGMKLSVITARVETYYRFRKLALIKKMPLNVLVLLDFAFELMSGKQYEALACLEEIKVKLGPRHYYATLLEYVAHDFLSEDEKKVKQAKRAMIDSIDQYCLKLLKIKDQ
ncbi:MAG: hypothetical protein Q7V05_03775 [Methanoregula sp.]|nr:hypothetical protein [Methanoregula sp.]